MHPLSHALQAPTLPTQRPVVPVLRLAVILGALTAFAPLATDMYLASFPALARHFRTDAARVQLTLSVFFFGLAFGQLIYGPVADRFGRRWPLLAGTGLFVVTSIAAVFAPNIEMLIVLRLLQAIGGCAGMVMGRAVISDLFEPREGASILSLLMVVQSIGPIVAPVLGAEMLLLGGWPAIFWCLGGFGALCLAAAAWGLPESLPVASRHPLAPGHIAASFAGLLRRGAFMRPVLAGSIAISTVFAYITGSPSVFMQIKGFSAQQYALLFAMNATFMVVAAQLNRWALARTTPAHLLRIGLWVNLAGALALLAASALPGLWLIAPLALCLATVPVVAANYTALAMGAGGDRAGSASSLIGVIQFSLASAASVAVGLLQNGTAWPMAGVIVACAAIGVVLNKKV
jgi:DHA1 family bicyclomycin/chloramphenicol resistance-like MFS transporter